MIIYLSVVGGVVISVALPFIRALVPKPNVSLDRKEFWKKIRPYVATGIFSLLTALLIVAGMGKQLDSWGAALLAGYTWDSTLQKFTSGNLGIIT